MELYKNVLVLGGTTFDHIVYLTELPGKVPHTIHEAGFAEQVGSTGTGKAVALHQLAMPVHLVSACGDDIWGEKIRHFLTEKKVPFTLIPDAAGTERHINLMDAQGKRISIFVTQSSALLSHPKELINERIAETDLIVLNIIAYCKNWVGAVRQSGKPVWTDLHDYDGISDYHHPFIDAAHHLQLSSDNLPDYMSFMENLIDRGKSWVVCTHAEQGASFLSRQTGWIHIDAEQVSVCDTNGAGDSFFAGLLFGWMQGFAPERCMRMATRAASLCVQSPLITSEALNAPLLLGVL